jgi:peptide/nickel transport system ATP-binding protein
MAHRVALMYAGQIIEVASAAEFFASPRHPYARALLGALPDAQHRGGDLAAIPGTVPSLAQTFVGCRFAPRCAVALPSCATTIPELLTLAERSVRCVLYEPGGPGLPAVAKADAVALSTEAAARGEAVSLSAAHARAKTPTPPVEPLLEVRDLSVRFPLRSGALGRAKSFFDAVVGASFVVGRSRTLALVGESGCGKTTTGKAIVQLLRGQATMSGAALLEGRNLFDLAGDDLRAARREIQIIFQDPFASLDPRMRVQELIEEGMAALRPEMSAADRRQRIEKLADEVGLRREALGRYPHEFSGGQRQRIAIARALAVQPRLLVCDEPTSALDVSVQAQILNLLRELQRELGVSYLFITHNIGVVEYIADEVAVMKAGRIVEQGLCSEVLGSPQHEYTRTLLAAVPRLQT